MRVDFKWDEMRVAFSEDLDDDGVRVEDWGRWSSEVIIV